MTKKKSKKVNMKRKKRRLKILKWTSLLVLIIGAITLFLLSPIFNVKEIIVNNNSKISSEEIINLSSIKKDINMFKFLKVKVKEQIRVNPYIESVEIHRHLNGKIEINVTERVATYIIAKEEGYAYINNQGYVLEISSEKPELPSIEGFTSEDITAGNRLELADLKKLNIIIQIVNSARENNIAEKISSINIESDNDIIIKMETELKTIHFGNGTRINDKIIKIIPVLEDNLGVSGQIFVKDIDKVYFRGDV